MNKNNQVFKAILTTKGRKTGKDHSVLLRAVQYNDRIYFSRHELDGDWFQNAIVNTKVKVKFSNTSYSGNAIKITDEELAKKISRLKYPGEQRANEKRVVLEVTLCEQL